MQTAAAKPQRRASPPKKDGFKDKGMPPAVEAVLQAAPSSRETAYASEETETLLSFARDLVREGEIPDALSLSREDPDLCSELRQRGLLSRLFAEDDKPKENTPVLESFSATTARTIELQGKMMTDKQMYQLICYLCFGIGTSKPLLGGVHSDKGTIQNRLLQKLDRGSEARAQFKTCWRRMKSADAILETKSKKTKVYSLNTRTDAITDLQIRGIVGKALKEQRSINCR